MQFTTSCLYENLQFESRKATSGTKIRYEITKRNVKFRFLPANK